MIDGAPNDRSGLPEWTTKAERQGLDPLGMQTTSVALYQKLIPGISNVTLRMRYYGLYAWLAQNYAKKVGDTSVDAWCRYLRRAEALYALAAVHHGGESGVAGSNWAGRLLANTTKGRVKFLDGTDRENGKPQYLKQKFGAFGAAYGSQLVEIGILEYISDHSIPVPTDGVGDGLAHAFNNAIGDSGEIFLKAATLGTVTKKGLANLESMLPSKIGKSSRERQLYQDLLFAKSTHQSQSAIDRCRSLRLILSTSLADQNLVNANIVRWTMYTSRNSQGALLNALPPEEERQRFAWQVYQANDLLHVAYEAVLKLTLDVLSIPPIGMPRAQLIEKVVHRLRGAISEWHAKTWSELVDAIAAVENPRSEDEQLSEVCIMKDIFDGSNLLAMTSDEVGGKALILLVILYKRHMEYLERIRAELPVLASGAFVQSLVTEIIFLSQNAEEPISTLLTRLVEQRIISRHYWVALQKFRRQGDYTFLFESDDGRLRVRTKDGPVLTNPRLSPAISFLKDIHLIKKDGLTPLGSKLLRAS